MKKKLYRSNHGLICGVCTGFAEYLGVSPWLVRGILLVIVVILAYLIAALVMPKKPEPYNDVFTLLKSIFTGQDSRQSSHSQKQGRKIVTDARERDVKDGKDDK